MLFALHEILLMIIIAASLLLILRQLQSLSVEMYPFTCIQGIIYICPFYEHGPIWYVHNILLVSTVFKDMDLGA